MFQSAHLSSVILKFLSENVTVGFRSAGIVSAASFISSFAEDILRYFTVYLLGTYHGVFVMGFSKSLWKRCRIPMLELSLVFP